MASLLTSPFSRVKKAIRHSSLVTPPRLPPHHNPDSNEARILGRLSLRRELNHRRRYFFTETRKVLPPLEIVETRHRVTVHNRKSLNGLQLPQMLRNMVVIRKPEEPRRSVSVTANAQEGSEESKNLTHVAGLPSRFLRRRHKLLLGKIPVLRYTETLSDNKPTVHSSFSVTMDPYGLSPDNQYSSDRLSEPDASNTAWIKLANNRDIIKGTRR